MTESSLPTDPVEHNAAVEQLREQTQEHNGEEQSIFDIDPELKNSMLYWFPILRDAVSTIESVKIPETLLVDITPINAYKLASETEEDISDAEMEAIMQCPAEWDVDQIKRATDYIGYPAFLRTDTDSDKHNIEAAGNVSTSTEEHIDDTMKALIRGAAGNSGMMGAPRFNFLAVREWIDIDNSFTAFDGTPIGPEVRVFVRDGEAECHHFYWPFHEQRMRDAVDGEYDAEKQGQVQVMEAKIDGTMEAFLRDAAEDIGWHFDGFWSVDFALTTDGDWYVIDMARGEDSWHPDTCPTVDAEPVEEDSVLDDADALLAEMDGE